MRLRRNAGDDTWSLEWCLTSSRLNSIAGYSTGGCSLIWNDLSSQLVFFRRWSDAASVPVGFAADTPRLTAAKAGISSCGLDQVDSGASHCDADDRNQRSSACEQSSPPQHQPTWLFDRSCATLDRATSRLERSGARLDDATSRLERSCEPVGRPSSRSEQSCAPFDDLTSLSERSSARLDAAASVFELTYAP